MVESMPPQFIYTIRDLKKIAPGTQREILKGIYLAFYPGAKIGVARTAPASRRSSGSWPGSTRSTSATPG